MRRKFTLVLLVLFANYTAHAAVKAEQAFVATPIPGTRLTAVYGDFLNDSDDEVHITRVDSDSSAAAELHEQRIDGNDVVRMRPVKRWTIPAHATLSLRKGGQHLMLIGLNRKLRDRDQVTLTLYFEHADPQQITLPVLRDASQLHEN